MSDSAFKDFICEYPFDGARWGFTITAVDHAEAQDRLRALAWASVKGEVVATIPASLPAAGLFVRVGCWLRNLFAARGAA